MMNVVITIDCLSDKTKQKKYEQYHIIFLLIYIYNLHIFSIHGYGNLNILIFN